MTTVLKDPEANRRLLRDGFVVVPFLDRTRAQELRALVHAELPHLASSEGPGFYCDMDTSDLDLRRRATEIIDREFGGPAADVFVSHRPFIRNFLQKWPGADSDVHLRCGSIPLTRGRMGRRGANIAIQVTAPLTPAAARALTGGPT